MELQLQNKTLYNIRIDHLELLQAIEDNEGELTPELEQALQLTEAEFQSKAISYGYLIKTFDDSSTIIEKEMERLGAILDRVDKRKDLFKNILSGAMQQFGVEKIETPLLKLSFRKSEAVEIVDEKSIPGQYKTERITIAISKTEIKDAIKKGFDVPGAQLITKKNLQIR
jgi:hypothetical protein